MARAWPFEDRPEGQAGSSRSFDSPEDYVARLEGTEAIVVRIGLNDAQLVLVDGRGAWQRWVYHSFEQAREVAGNLGVEVHEGEYPEETRVRMNAYQRSAEDFERGAYPEQGQVGPVIPYPENRPRSLSDPAAEADDHHR